jgi:hypothetical protein
MNIGFDKNTQLKAFAGTVLTNENKGKSASIVNQK